MGLTAGGLAPRRASRCPPAPCCNCNATSSRTTSGRRTAVRAEPGDRYSAAAARDPPLATCPDGVPWKDRFAEADAAAESGDWQTAAERLAALAGRRARCAGRLARIWPRSAAGWPTTPAASRPCGKYAALRAGEPDGLEDAVEAEAKAMFLADDPLGDRLEMFKLVWTVKDVERAQEAFLSSPRCRAVPFDPAQFSDGQNAAAEGRLHAAGSPHARVGRRADSRHHAAVARPGPAVRPADRPRGPAGRDGRGGRRSCRPSTQMVRDAAGDAVEPEPKQEVIGHWSASQILLRGRRGSRRGAPRPSNSTR